MDEEVRNGEHQGLEVRVSEKTMVKKIGDILNPFNSARSSVLNRPFPLSPRALYGLGFAAPFIVVGSVIVIVSALAYGIKEGIEKYLF